MAACSQIYPNQISATCKSLLRFCALLTGILIINSSASAQVEEYLVRFDVQSSQNKVLITFTTSKGFTCEDVIIEHGTDTNSLTPIHTFLGICGARETEESYAFVFENPTLNATNFFRINLGVYGLSDAVSLRLLGGLANQPRVIPNPISSSSSIYWSNSNAELCEVYILNKHGIELGRLTTSGSTAGINNFDIDVAGMYFVFVEFPNFVGHTRFYYLGD
ncbi:MAG: hypothetical protein ACI8ZN_001787 [Bacteroidia bacterium]|jgi:hypothetical protein